MPFVGQSGVDRIVERARRARDGAGRDSWSSLRNENGLAGPDGAGVGFRLLPLRLSAGLTGFGAGFRPPCGLHSIRLAVRVVHATDRHGAEDLRRISAQSSLPHGRPVTGPDRTLCRGISLQAPAVSRRLGTICRQPPDKRTRWHWFWRRARANRSKTQNCGRIFAGRRNVEC